jgi:hypothetical protein
MNEQIARWGKLVGIDDASEPGDLIGLFQYFRPDGIGIESIFAGQPFGEAILARVRRCYECTRTAFVDRNLYFIPRPQVACDDSEAIRLLRLHFLEMSKLATHRHDSELVQILTDVSPLRVTSRTDLQQIPISDDSPEGWLYDLVTDFVGSLVPQESPLILLRDAMYSIANNIFVKNFLLWPLYVQSFPAGDPFQPAFELWCRGVSHSFRTPTSCRYLIGSSTVAPSEK